jgi:hypothetical protein
MRLLASISRAPFDRFLPTATTCSPAIPTSPSNTPLAVATVQLRNTTTKSAMGPSPALLFLSV